MMEKIMKNCFNLMRQIYGRGKNDCVIIKFDGEFFYSYIDDDEPSDGVPFKHRAQTPKQSLLLLFSALKEDK